MNPRGVRNPGHNITQVELYTCNVVTSKVAKFLFHKLGVKRSVETYFSVQELR